MECRALHIALNTVADERTSRVEVANVAPDLSSVLSYTPYYIQYNWHGDAVAFAPLTGGYAGTYDPHGIYDPWGNPSLWPPNSLSTWNYYRWAGAWGYMKFDDLGLYYVHGRWFNPDTGLFLSPDNNGEYLYNSGNDAVNKAWSSTTFSTYYNRPRHFEPVPKPPIVPRAQWGALEPGKHLECAPGFGGVCVNSGWAEGLYDPTNNPSGYARYSDLLPDIALESILDTIVIDHEGNNQTYDPRHVQREHMFGNGWWDIGYHFIIGPAGTIYEGRNIGVRGSHVKGANTGKLGVLFLGDFEPGLGTIDLKVIRILIPDPTGDDPGPTNPQVDSALSLIRWLDQEYGIDAVVGHSYLNSTECPGQNLKPFIPLFNQVAQER